VETVGSFGTWLGRWVDAVRRHPFLVVVATLAVTAAVLPVSVARLGMHVDPLELLREDAPYRQLRAEYYEAFPGQKGMLLLVIDGEVPDRVDDAARALAERLEQEPDLFPSVYLPGGGAFFERHGLLYREADELEELGDRLAELQPYVAELSRDPSLRGFFELMVQVVEESDDPREAEVAEVLELTAEVVEARAAGRPRPLSWQSLLFGEEASPDRRVILVRPAVDEEDLQPARLPILMIRERAEALGIHPENGLRMRITGDLALNFEEMTAVRAQGRRAGLLSLVAVAVILGVALRWRLTWATLATLLVGLAWTAIFASWAIGRLNMVSVAFAVLFIGLGVDFGVHLSLRYRELLGLGRRHQEALRAAASDTGASLLLCAMTTAIAFYAFVPTEFLGVAELGLIAGTGMFVSLFFTLTLLPALLSLRPRAVPAAGSVVGEAAGRRALPLRRPGLVLAGAGVAAAVGLALLPQVYFDPNPLRVRDPSTESVRTLDELLAQAEQTTWTIEVLESDLESAHRLARELEGLEAVAEVATARDLVPEDQEAKLAILEDVALFLGPALGAKQRPAPTPAEQRRALERLLAALEERASASDDPLLGAAAERLVRALGGLDGGGTAAGLPAEELAGLEQDLLGTLPDRLRRLQAALVARPVGLDDVPASLRSRMLTADGRARVQVLPSGDLTDNAELVRFVESVREVTPRATGNAVSYLEAARSVVGSFQQALISAFAVIAGLLWLLWRRIDDTLRVLITLLLAALLTAAASVILAIPFNFADVIVVPLLLGIGVDSAIHLVHRYRSEPERFAALWRTGTVRAVVVSGLTTVASFGTLGLQSHRGMASMGQLLTVGVVLMLLCNLLVLPALLAAGRRPGSSTARPSDGAAGRRDGVGALDAGPAGVPSGVGVPQGSSLRGRTV